MYAQPVMRQWHRKERWPVVVAALLGLCWSTAVDPSPNESCSTGPLCNSLLQRAFHRQQIANAVPFQSKNGKDVLDPGPPIYQDMIDENNCTPQQSCSAGNIPEYRGLCVDASGGPGTGPNECWDICNTAHEPAAYIRGQSQNDTTISNYIADVRASKYPKLMCPGLPSRSVIFVHPGNASLLGNSSGASVKSAGLEAIKAALADTTLSPTAESIQILDIDDACTNSSTNSALASRVEQMLAAQPTVVAVVGSGCNAAEMPLAAFTSARNIVQIGYGSTLPLLANRTRFPFYMRTNLGMTSLAFARASLFPLFDWHHAALLAPNFPVFDGQSYGDLAALAAKRAFENLEGITLDVYLYDASTSESGNISSSIDLVSIKTTGVRVIVLDIPNGEHTMEVMNNAARLRMLGSDGYCYIVGAAAMQGVQNYDAANAIEGALYFSYPDWSMPQPAAPMAYDAMMAVIRGLALVPEGGPALGPALLKAMYSLDFQGSFGKVTFDSAGERNTVDLNLVNVQRTDAGLRAVVVAQGQATLASGVAMFDFNGTIRWPGNSSKTPPSCIPGTCKVEPESGAARGSRSLHLTLWLSIIGLCYLACQMCVATGIPDPRRTP